MKRNDILRFIINHKILYKFFTRFKWFNDLAIKRAREIIWNTNEPSESED